MRIYHNIPALYAYNALNATNNALQKSIRTLSTGLRINSAADDAAGLAISEKMRSQINGLNMAVRNAQDGISMLQTAEGALSEVHSILQRMRELSVQAANDTLTQQDRQYIQLEIDQLKSEIDRTSTATQFNKKRLLDGSSAGLWSSNDLATKAYIRGSLRQIDRFGQKAAFEGNYKIQINANPGQAEAMKTDVFKIKHKNVVMGVSLNDQAGVSGLRVDNLPAGSYTVKTAAAAANSGVEVTGKYGFPEKYHKLVTTTGALAADVGKKFKISVGSGAPVEITVPTPAAANPSAAEIANVIRAAGIAGLSVNETGGNITLISTKGEIKIEDVDLVTAVGTVFPNQNSTEETATFSDLLNTPIDDNKLENNASILYEVLSVNAQSKSVTLKATANILRPDGTVTTKVDDNIVLTEGGAVDLSEKLGLGAKDSGAFKLELKAGMTGLFSVGNKFVHNVTKKATGADARTVEISGTQTQSWPFKWGDNVTDKPLKFGLDASKVTEKELHFRSFYLNSKNGTVYEGDIVLKTNATKMTADKTLATFEAAYIGQVAKKDVHLRDLDKFWDSQGRFLLTDPQTINIAQGDGKNTSITLYATDTLAELRSKLNGAIANGLEQARFAVSHANSFVTFVEEGTKQEYGLETVPGTFIIRSMVAGAAGRLSFSGDEDLIKALSLNVVQEAKENSFTASIYDAHNGATVVNNVTVSGNQLIGVIHPNVDVEFDPMANIRVEWNENLRNFELKKINTPYETILHLVDNSTVFQVGANEGEDVAIDIGNMSADALGVTRVIVTDRVSAARAISILDNAIAKVSTQRAKIGAFQNSLEHTVTNLTTTGTNLTAAESRIRDADMSLEMLNFTKLQILSQSGTAMLAQANQLPQTVLSLIRG
nr:flagellin [uncultured Fretibacterium sp.]